LLTLELEDLSRAGDAERRRRSEVARTLLAGTRDEPAARDLLASVGLRAATVRVVAVVASQPCAGPGPVEATLGRLLEALPDALTADDGERALLLVPDPPEGLADLVQEAVGATADAAAGIGATVAPSAAARSARSACRAAEVARATGPRVVDVLALASSRLLLTLQPHGAVAAFADAVLGPVEQAGGRGGALLSSLRAFLECNGSWEEAAARLGVHRHTLRQRLRRVEELSGRRLDSGHDRMELLLAFEARDLAGHT
jgi:purine catabolism regulator